MAKRHPQNRKYITNCNANILRSSRGHATCTENLAKSDVWFLRCLRTDRQTDKHSHLNTPLRDIVAIRVYSYRLRISAQRQRRSGQTIIVSVSCRRRLYAVLINTECKQQVRMTPVFIRCYSNKTAHLSDSTNQQSAKQNKNIDMLNKKYKIIDTRG